MRNDRKGNKNVPGRNLTTHLPLPRTPSYTPTCSCCRWDLFRSLLSPLSRGCRCWEVRRTPHKASPQTWSIQSLVSLGILAAALGAGQADPSGHRGSAPRVAAPLPPLLTSFPTPSPGLRHPRGLVPRAGCGEVQRSGGSSPAPELQRREKEPGREPADVNPSSRASRGSACLAEPRSPKERWGLQHDFQGKGPHQRSQGVGPWGSGISSSPVTHGQEETRPQEPQGALGALGTAFP